MYTESRRGLLWLGQMVETPEGVGYVRALNVLLERATVELPGGRRVELSAADLNVPGDVERRFGRFWNADE